VLIAGAHATVNNNPGSRVHYAPHPLDRYQEPLTHPPRRSPSPAGQDGIPE
jgi:hypothetical protein